MKKYAGKISLFFAISVILIQSLLGSAFAYDDFAIDYNRNKKCFYISTPSFQCKNDGIDEEYFETLLPEDTNMMTAVYKNNILQAAFPSVPDESGLLGGEAYTYNTGDVSGLSDYSFKLFLWGSNLNPVCEPSVPNNYGYGCILTAADGTPRSISVLTDSGETKSYELTDECKIIGDYEWDTFAEAEAYCSMYGESIFGSYCRYTLENGKISKLYTPDGWGWVGSGKAVRYNASSHCFGQDRIDSDSIVYLLKYNSDGSIDAANSVVGNTDLLENGLYYTYITHTNGWSIYSNRVVVSAVTEQSPDNCIAVITSAEASVNASGETVYSLSYYKEGALFENKLTSARVYSSVSGLTKGDIVKLDITNEDVVTGITEIVDFLDPVRAVDGTVTASSLSSEPETDEEYAFGYITRCSPLSKSVVIGGNTYSLISSAYVYVIDTRASGTTVDTGVVSDVEFDPDITEDFEIYSEYVFVRKYKNLVREIVIIKPNMLL